jgi:GTP pyrophosphokinase
MLSQDYGASPRDALEGTLGRLLDLLRRYQQQSDPSTYFMEWVKQAFSSSPSDRKLIGRTLAFANFVHKGQRRVTGEKYITHPIAAAAIIGEHLDIRDPTAIAGALGHDTREDHEILTLLAPIWRIDATVIAIIDACNRNGYQKIRDKRERDDTFLGGILRGELPAVRLVKSAEKLHNNLTPAPQKLTDPHWRARKVSTIRKWYEPMTESLGHLEAEMIASRIAIEHGFRMI